MKHIFVRYPKGDEFERALELLKPMLDTESDTVLGLMTMMMMQRLTANEGAASVMSETVSHFVLAMSAAAEGDEQLRRDMLGNLAAGTRVVAQTAWVIAKTLDKDLEEPRIQIRAAFYDDERMN